jgi:hypothetical protein
VHRLIGMSRKEAEAYCDPLRHAEWSLAAMGHETQGGQATIEWLMRWQGPQPKQYGVEPPQMLFSGWVTIEQRQQAFRISEVGWTAREVVPGSTKAYRKLTRGLRGAVHNFMAGMERFSQTFSDKLEDWSRAP